ncbi:hypothetical protein ABZ370_17860 [Streptomyces sp. NPDC005962]|uniref:hypothetical protein n=1 Tax=Streptomyces sp. NPDC005962 TaxID=3154466 RepID=UPI00340EA5CC
MALLMVAAAYTRGVSENTGESLVKVVRAASYTADPVIEELMKLAPLLFMAWNVRIRRQWGVRLLVRCGLGLGQT